jgi:hypothetical protein
MHLSCTCLRRRGSYGYSSSTQMRAKLYSAGDPPALSPWTLAISLAVLQEKRKSLIFLAKEKQTAGLARMGGQPTSALAHTTNGRVQISAWLLQHQPNPASALLIFVYHPHFRRLTGQTRFNIFCIVCEIVPDMCRQTSSSREVWCLVIFFDILNDSLGANLWHNHLYVYLQWAFPQCTPGCMDCPRGA